jgi:hypothetical protein
VSFYHLKAKVELNAATIGSRLRFLTYVGPVKVAFRPESVSVAVVE